VTPRILETRYSPPLICMRSSENFKTCGWRKAGHCTDEGQNYTNDSRPLYFARVDIRSAFDTVNQDKLLDIIFDVIKGEDYALHRYCELNIDRGKITKRFDVRASSFGTFPSKECS